MHSLPELEAYNYISGATWVMYVTTYQQPQYETQVRFTRPLTMTFCELFSITPLWAGKLQLSDWKTKSHYLPEK